VTLVGDEGPSHPPKRLGESRQVSASASLGETPAQPYKQWNCMGASCLGAVPKARSSLAACSALYTHTKLRTIRSRGGTRPECKSRERMLNDSCSSFHRLSRS